MKATGASEAANATGHKHLTPMRTPGTADGPPPSRERPSDAPPCREHFAKQITRLEARWRLRGRHRSHDHLPPMRTPGAVDGPPPSREWRLDAHQRMD